MPAAEDRRYDAIYLSPHLDDAVLSCGGQIHRFTRDGQRVLVVTVTAGTPDPASLSAAARELHRVWGLADDEAVAARRREDLAACAVVGAEALHWDELDALYRRSPGGVPWYPTVAAVFDPPPVDDAAEVLEAWTARLRGLPAAARVVAPLGAGHHVDHVLLRDAAERVFGARLEHFEDYPYARKWWVRRKALGRRRGWEDRVWALGRAALDAKCRAIECYTSQLGTAFADLADLRRQIERFAAEIGGERLWFRADSG